MGPHPLPENPNSNLTSHRLRDGGTVTYSYDALDRVTARGSPSPEPVKTYAYDNLGRMTSANRAGISLSFAYDALGRLIRETGPQGTACSEWDSAGRRTKLVYPTANCASSSAFFVTYEYYVTGEVRYLFERGITTGPEHLATIALDQLGNRERLVRGNGTRTLYAYDPVSRLAELTLDFPSSADNQTTAFTHNPASQITSLTRSNDAWAFTGLTAGTTDYTINGLNQYATVDGTAPTYDARGNMTFDPVSGKTYSYWPSNNQLRTVNSPFTSLSYDALDRLSIVDSSTDSRFAYDGLDVIAEFDGAGALRNRYVFVPGIDEPLVSYTASGTRTWLTADERGSIVAHSNDSGAVTRINRYDEYGIPASTNIGRFQYTGQMWLPEAGVYHYKFRAFDPKLGRFLQTDPIGYAGGMNLYVYAADDPINIFDPFGLENVCVAPIGSHIKDSCVGVDGDGDGLVSDNDLTVGQVNRFAHDYYDFILAHGTPRGLDISLYGKPTLGLASDHDVATVRVATQFLGAAIAFYGDPSVRGSWSKIDFVYAGTRETSQRAGWSRWQNHLQFIVITGRSGGADVENFYTRPSDIGRILIHEALHGTHPLRITAPLHHGLDQRARMLLRRWGLGGGGCLAIGGFAGC